MATIFTKIAAGEIPSYKCAENEDFYAFLDISPLAKGHTLVIPKHVEDDYIFHLDQKTYEGLWAFARKVAVALKAAVPCKRGGSPYAYSPGAPPDGRGPGLPQGQAKPGTRRDERNCSQNFLRV